MLERWGRRWRGWDVYVQIMILSSFPDTYLLTSTDVPFWPYLVTNSGTNFKYMHTGLDIEVSCGDGVVATFLGIVRTAQGKNRCLILMVTDQFVSVREEEPT